MPVSSLDWARHIRGLDAVHRGVAQHLDQAVLDGRGVGRRHVTEPGQRQLDALGMVLGEARRHRLQRRRQVLDRTHRRSLGAAGGRRG
ncbi:MAG TPA: hypothetical protein VEY89_07890, partial [Candidatus Dormibacteraeota bacterium]|nr:hypothetical protein [Candidatus Dormibacteraeota bacterium]